MAVNKLKKRMAIIIPHRFKDRISPTDKVKTFDYIIIGTFNPNSPIINELSETEKKRFKEISKKPKFITFNEIENFYDRPQNRFWKIMDYINNPSFYENNDYSLKNLDGLKFYKGMNRKKVFEKQKTFCETKKILITDIVSEIKPISFCDIYDNFPDKAIENSECKFNTENILTIIKKNNIKKVIVNFKTNDKTIPKISTEINKIITTLNVDFEFAMSTSGAAGNSYEDLISKWKEYLK